MGSLRTSREARLKIKGGGVREDRGNASATLHVRPFGVDGSCYDIGIATRVSRPTPKSLQQVLDPRFELFGIVGPVAIDFQAVGSDSPAVRGAPLTQCLVHGSKFLIGPPMNDYCRFARWRPAARSQEGPATGHESRLSPCRVEHAAELPIGPVTSGRNHDRLASPDVYIVSLSSLSLELLKLIPGLRVLWIEFQGFL